jgi:hypothetical protein
MLCNGESSRVHVQNHGSSRTGVDQTLTAAPIDLEFDFELELAIADGAKLKLEESLRGKRLARNTGQVGRAEFPILSS